MASTNPYGQRLIPSLIDHYSITEPDRPWGATPRSDDLTKRFVGITYRQFATAINRTAFWLEECLGASHGDFQTFAYAGEKDIRYPIIAVAAVKIGRKILLPSPFTTDEAQVHLLKSTDCQAFVCSKSFEGKVNGIIQGHRKIPVITVLELHELLDEGSAPNYEYAKSWDEAKSDPWLIFHTSGTTVFLGATIVFGPTDQPPTTEVLTKILDYGALDGIIVPPSMLENLCNNADSLAKVKQLKYVQYAGAPLIKEIGDKIANDVRLTAAIGSTEAGAWFPRVHHDADWDYYSFMKGTGIEFEHQGNNLYELVFRRKEEYKKWQQIFDVFPDLDVFRTKDLFSKHPTKEDRWQYAGRADDIVNLSHGKDLHAATLEKIIEGHPSVRCALVGGEGRQTPFLVVELSEEPSDDSAALASVRRQEQIDKIWPVVEQANESCIESVRLTKELTLLAKAEKPLRRTAKGTVARRESAALYTGEIEALYGGFQRS
ncbi:MAG: hypothetical protein Q9170_003852 [Blastenia crenularia]